jgi:hypothetical protein
MDSVKVVCEGYRFDAVFESKAAPKTVAVFKTLLPYENKVIHVRWSGEAVWIPLGEHDFGLSYENHTSYPAPGQMIVYPGGISETEILLAYGGVRFASKMGQLAGNHFLTITSDLDKLAQMCKSVLWDGAKTIRIEAA